MACLSSQGTLRSSAGLCLNGRIKGMQRHFGDGGQFLGASQLVK